MNIYLISTGPHPLAPVTMDKPMIALGFEICGTREGRRFIKSIFSRKIVRQRMVEDSIGMVQFFYVLSEIFVLLKHLPIEYALDSSHINLI